MVTYRFRNKRYLYIILQREISKEEGNEISIKYERNMSDDASDEIELLLGRTDILEGDIKNIAHILYEDEIPSYDSVYLKREDREVTMWFFPRDFICVDIRVAEISGIDKALRQAEEQSPINNLKKEDYVKINFYKTASIGNNKVNSIGDMQNACNFVWNYFRK